MASTVSVFLRGVLLRQAFRGETLLTDCYLAITRRVPEANADGLSLDEPVGGGYSRVHIGLGTDAWGLTGFDEIYNLAEFTFPTATNYWGICAGFALCDAAAAGNTLAVGPMQNPLRIDLGIAPVVRANAIVLGLTD